eukprot:5011989-Pyramimonas_sp.AAC.3
MGLPDSSSACVFSGAQLTALVCELTRRQNLAVKLDAFLHRPFALRRGHPRQVRGVDHASSGCRLF